MNYGAWLHNFGLVSIFWLRVIIEVSLVLSRCLVLLGTILVVGL